VINLDIFDDDLYSVKMYLPTPNEHPLTVVYRQLELCKVIPICTSINKEGRYLFKVIWILVLQYWLCSNYPNLCVQYLL